MGDAEAMKRIEKYHLQILKKYGMAPSTVHCQVIQNNYLERCSNTCTFQNGLH